MEGIDPHSPWLQLGAVGVLALVCILMIRDWRKESQAQTAQLVTGFTNQVQLFADAIKDLTKQFTQELGTVRMYMAALLERERMKGEKRAARDVAIARSSGIPDVAGDDLTAPLDLPELQPRKPQRAKTDPYMIVRPRNGDG